MNTIRTIKTYSESIRNKYVNDEKSGKLRGNLYQLTRSNIRNVCISLIDENLSVDDERIMRNYFNLKSQEDLRYSIKNYSIGGFRPIYNFLKGNNETIQSIDALELTALIINYIPRPFNNYRVSDSQIKSNEKIKTDDIVYDVDSKSGKSIIKVTPKRKTLFVWFSNASAFNKLLTFSSILLFGIAIFFNVNHFLNNKVKWMVWNQDHYEAVKFDDEKYNVNQLKYYKEDRIKYFRKIRPNCDYKFFRKNGSVKVWYGKNKNKELEYFTDLGLHPETGKTLKPITQYMINKYICDTND